MHGHFTVLYGMDVLMNSLFFGMDDLANSPSPIVWTINFQIFFFFMHKWFGDVGVLYSVGYLVNFLFSLLWNIW